MSTVPHRHRIYFWLLWLSFGLLPVAGRTDENDAQAVKQKERTEKLLKWTREFTKGTRVTVRSGKLDVIARADSVGITLTRG